MVFIYNVKIRVGKAVGKLFYFSRKIFFFGPEMKSQIQTNKITTRKIRSILNVKMVGFSHSQKQATGNPFCSIFFPLRWSRNILFYL